MTSNWQQIRLQVLERDSYLCQHCGGTNKLDVHHKIPRHKGGLDILENLITFCRKCHKIEEFKDYIRIQTLKATWRIPDNLMIELKHMAIDDRISLNELAVQALKEYVNKRKSKK